MGERGALVIVGALLAGCTPGTEPEDKYEQPAAVELPEDCSALPEQSGMGVLDAEGLVALLAEATAGDVIELDAGTYELSAPIVIPDGVTVRSGDGDAGFVVLEGGFATAELVQMGDGATLAEVTLSRSYGDAVAIRAASDARVYGVHVVDPGGRGVAVLPERGVYSDDATIACVTVTRSTACNVAIEGVQTEGTRVYGATIDQPACDEPGIRFATGSKDTVIERSRVTVAGPVAFQLGDEDYVEDEPRAHADAPCDDEQRGHYGGVVRNVFAVGGGVRVEDACGARVEHVSAWGGDLSWSFADDLVVENNLASLLDPGGAGAGNLTPTAADFVDADGGDLHLAEGSAAIGAAVPSDVTDDIDGDPRDDGAPDVGADQR